MTAPSSVTVIVPVLNRPRSVGPLVTSLFTSVSAETSAGWFTDVLFVASEGDTEELTALSHMNETPLLVGHVRDEHQYPRKVNAAAHATDSEWLLLAADDLRFHPGWLTAALRAHQASGALVVGTNDLGNPLVKSGRHATHPLVHRSYLEQGTIDEPGVLLHEGYHHNSCDVEFCETAMFRNTFVFAKDSVVAHHHPLWDRSVKRDPVYAKGIRFAAHDRRLLNKRRHLWQHPRDPDPVRGRPPRRSRARR